MKITWGGSYCINELLKRNLKILSRYFTKIFYFYVFKKFTFNTKVSKIKDCYPLMGTCFINEP